MRPDREGHEYARSRGHSAQAVQQAAQKLFAQGSNQASLFDSPERVKALEALGPEI